MQRRILCLLITPHSALSIYYYFSGYMHKYESVLWHYYEVHYAE